MGWHRSACSTNPPVHPEMVRAVPGRVEARLANISVCPAAGVRLGVVYDALPVESLELVALTYAPAATSATYHVSAPLAVNVYDCAPPARSNR